MKKANGLCAAPQRAQGSGVSFPGTHFSLRGTGGSGSSGRRRAAEIPAKPPLNSRFSLPKTGNSHIKQKQDSWSLRPTGTTAGKRSLRWGTRKLPSYLGVLTSQRSDARPSSYPRLRTPRRLASLRLPPRGACDWPAAMPGGGARPPIGQRSEPGFRSRRFQIRARVRRSHSLSYAEPLIGVEVLAGLGGLHHLVWP